MYQRLDPTVRSREGAPHSLIYNPFENHLVSNSFFSSAPPSLLLRSGDSFRGVAAAILETLILDCFKLELDPSGLFHSQIERLAPSDLVAEPRLGFAYRRLLLHLTL
ncbi:hypothetical protein GW17_00017036 [Ensete ventricosum]|nr:hypothetical protein GW17_00017036 [Ensete ventricosum]